MFPKVTVGLCVKNGEKVVKTAFESISTQNYQHKSMKVVIVDDGSTDNTLSLALDFAKNTDIQTFVVTNKNPGLGAARQIVLENAEGDYILWVDDDLVLTPDYLKNQVTFMEKEASVAVSKGREKEIFGLATINMFNFINFMPLKKPLKQIGIGGSIFRLKPLKEIKGFDIQIKGAGEDIDVSRRISASGWTLAINPSAQVHQRYRPATLKALWRRNFGYGYGNHYLFHKYKDLKIVIEYFPPYALVGSIKMSNKIYQITKLKKVFAFSLMLHFSKIAEAYGFTTAHINHYGHSE